MPYAEKVASDFGLKWNEAECDTYKNGVRILEQIDEVDPNSFAFRYPIDKAGKPIKHHEWGFDLLSFAVPTNKVLNGWWELVISMKASENNTSDIGICVRPHRDLWVLPEANLSSLFRLLQDLSVGD